MRRLGLIAATAAVLALTGCGAGQPTPSPATTSWSTTLTDQEARFMAELGAIDPDLTEKPDRELRRASNVCLDIAQGKDDQTIVDNTRQRYSNDTTVHLSPEEAQRIVEAARATVC